MNFNAKSKKKLEQQCPEKSRQVWEKNWSHQVAHTVKYFIFVGFNFRGFLKSYRFVGS